MSTDDRTVFVDPDRTLLVPRPGGRANLGDPLRAAAAQAKSASAITLQRLVAGINPLLAAASQLLALVAQLRATTSHTDRPGLHQQLLKLVGDFEEQARASGVSKPQVAAARYLLCTFIDEVIAATPWGADPTDATRGLLQEFHEDPTGADKVFELLDRLSVDAAANLDLLELFYVCFALGFQGRLAAAPDPRAQVQAVTDRLLELIRPAGRPLGPRSLSQHWVGQAVGHGVPLSVLPLWIVVAVGAALLLAAVMFMATRLNRQAEPALQQLHEVRSALRSERTAQAGKARLAPLLRDDIAGAGIEVRDELQRSVITLAADRLFVAGTAQFQPGMRELLGRIATQLQLQLNPQPSAQPSTQSSTQSSTQPGVQPGQQGSRIEVIGHSDNQAVQSLRYPSNWHLSREQAGAVAELLVQRGLSAQRLRSEGRADVEPRSSNDTPAARERNRRVEILLLLARPDA